MRRLILAFLILASPLPALSQQLINVFVQSENGGFTAPGASDSALDLQKSLRNKPKTLRVVDSESEADIIVRIDGRDSRKEVDSFTSNSNTSKDGRSTTKTTTANDKTVRMLHATLISGDYSMPLNAESDMGWRFAADNIAGQVERWARDNSARLMARRTTGGNPAPPSPPTPNNAPFPPDPPAAASEATIQPGMTSDQVIKSLGEPQKKVNFGTKSLWTYKGMQVVFESGKVTDVKF